MSTIKIILATKKSYRRDIPNAVLFPEDNMTPQEQAKFHQLIENKDMTIVTNSDYIVKSLAVYDLRNYMLNKNVIVKLYDCALNLLNENKSLWELDEIDYFDKPYDQLIREFSRMECKVDDES